MSDVQLIDQLFNQLDDWRNLPAYQLERRADIFFAIYLPDIIKGRFNQDIEFVVPEFPVRLGNVYKKKSLDNPNLSFKIDYVAVSNKTKHVYFIELKTDDCSRREKQDWYLETAKSNNIKDLVDGILLICKATSSKVKYSNLVSLLENIGWIDKSKMLNTSHVYDITIVYIQPNNDKSGKTVISFTDIINYLSKKDDNLTTRFCKSLETWKTNPNAIK